LRDGCVGGGRVGCMILIWSAVVRGYEGWAMGKGWICSVLPCEGLFGLSGCSCQLILAQRKKLNVCSEWERDWS